MLNSIVEAISIHAAQFPDKVCIIDRESSLTYKEYYSMILRYAAAFKNLNVKKGDRVVIKSAQTAKFLAALHAVHLISAVAVPLEKNVKAERLIEIAAQTQAVLIICDLDIKDYKTVSCNELGTSNENFFVKHFPDKEDISTILFTTGTTGKSKGVVVTHRSDCATGENVMFGTQMTPDTREVLPMPLNHSFSLRRYYSNMLTGSSVILMDGVIFVDKFFECFEKHGANAAALAPSALSIIFSLSGDKIGDFKDRIDYMEFGSAHLPQDDKDRLKSLLPNTRLYDFYGSSEAGCACMLSFNSKDDKPFCIGRDTVNSKIAFVDEDGKMFNATEKQPGRLVTSGAIIMEGYYNDEQLTSETLVNGYVQSNDLGYRDESGLVFMLGRIDNVIITGGNKVSPIEVEDVCLKCPGIKDCAVIGKKDELMGEIPVIFVCTDENYSESVLVNFLHEKLESFQVPKQIFIVEAIPRTYNGKILHRELKKLL